MTSSESRPETTSSDSERALPLTGKVVLDLSRVLAGPWCTQTLADLGATVIKVERPGVGDDTRHWGPPFLSESREPTASAGEGRGDAAYYVSANRGKYSIEVDLAHPEGNALIRRIAQRADILVENFKTGGLERYGLDYASLSAENPSLVYASITGFGQTGPDRARPGYDLIVQAMSGLMSITGRPDAEPGNGPIKVGVAVSDLFAGLYTTIGILAALSDQERTGKGQHVDVALLDAQVATLANQGLNYLVGGAVPPRLGNAHPNIVPYQAFETRDGEMVIAAANPGQFRSLCEVIGLESVLEDPDYATNADRVTRREALVGLISEKLRTATTDEWVERLDAKGVPCGPIRSLDQVFDPTRPGAERLSVGIPRGTDSSEPVIPSLTNPIRFSRTAIDYPKAPPRLGEDTKWVLREILALNDEDVADLVASGAIPSAPGHLRGSGD